MIVDSREGRILFTLLENPKGLGHADMPEMPTERTEIRMYLSAEVDIVYISKKLERVGPRFFESRKNLSSVIHTTLLCSIWRNCGSREASKPRRPPSGTAVQVPSSHSRSEAITPARGNIPASFT